MREKLTFTLLFFILLFIFRFSLSLMYGDVGLQELAHSPTAGVPATKRRKGRGGRVHRVWSPSGGEGGGEGGGVRGGGVVDKTKCRNSK